MTDADNELAKFNLIVQVNPKYPSQAAREAIEGWVMLLYTISKNGTVEDIIIKDASPEKVFDRSPQSAGKMPIQTLLRTRTAHSSATG